MYLSIWTTPFSEISNALLQVRSYYSAQNVTDVALYTEPEEIYLMKKNGNLKTVLLNCCYFDLNSPRQCCIIRCHGEERDCENQQHCRTWRCSPAGQLGLPTFCQWKRTDLCHAGEPPSQFIEFQTPTHSKLLLFLVSCSFF